ncbi:MAG: hypothetical protein NT062_06560 [Proteobacteria bacterium]|nr:hypothetical protein [Pseudomonadota bacterium]
MSKSFSNGLGDFETTFTAGATIDDQLATFYASVAQVAASPTDADSRDAVVAAARMLANGIRHRGEETASARNDADTRIRDNATNATDLAKQLAAANTSVVKTSDPVARDLRDQIATQLAEITGGAARIDPDGQMRFVLDGGAVLVDGTHAASLVASTTPPSTYAKLEVVDGNSRRDVTAAISTGAIGGDLQLRDRTFARVATQLDQLAYDVTTQVNTVHTANAALDGTSGHVMFVPIGAVAGAAASMAIDPTLDVDSANLATSAVGAGPGDNTGARAMFALSSSSSLGNDALKIVADLARDGKAARGDVARDEIIGTHLDDLRDSLAGVDTQEELTNLARFENVSNAMTKFVHTIDDMLSTLINQL